MFTAETWVLIAIFLTEQLWFLALYLKARRLEHYVLGAGLAEFAQAFVVAVIAGGGRLLGNLLGSAKAALSALKVEAPSETVPKES